MFPSYKENPVANVVGIVVLVVLAVFLSLASVKTYREAKEVGHLARDRDTITIAGTGKVASKPDLAVVNLGLYSEGKEVPVIQDENSRKVNAVIAALKQLGIAEEDMQTSNYNISPKYDYKDGVQNVIGYSVSQNLNVKVRDLTKVGTVLSQAGTVGANQVNGVNFSIDDPSDLKIQARAKAIEDARKKADELAKAMGVSITRVVTFSENSSNVPTPPVYTFRAEDVAAQAPDIKPGSLDVEADISVTFEIR
ncbi:MAG: SIMPL domain-containing protein [Patescibacteria group bacterium]